MPVSTLGSSRRSTRPSVYSTRQLPGTEGDLALGTVAGGQPQQQAAGLVEDRHRSVRLAQQRGRVPGLAVAQRPAGRVDDGHDGRGQRLADGAADELIERGEQLGGLVSGRQGPGGAADLAHRDGGLQPVPGDITDHQHQPAVGQRDGVVPVTPHAVARLGRQVARSQARARELGQGPGQQAALQRRDQVAVAVVRGGPADRVRDGRSQRRQGDLVADLVQRMRPAEDEGEHAERSSRAAQRNRGPGLVIRGLPDELGVGELPAQVGTGRHVDDLGGDQRLARRRVRRQRQITPLRQGGLDHPDGADGQRGAELLLAGQDQPGGRGAERQQAVLEDRRLHIGQRRRRDQGPHDGLKSFGALARAALGLELLGPSQGAGRQPRDDPDLALLDVGKGLSGRPGHAQGADDALLPIGQGQRRPPLPRRQW